jgi:hypothetical protein
MRKPQCVGMTTAIRIAGDLDRNLDTMRFLEDRKYTDYRSV